MRYNATSQGEADNRGWVGLGGREEGEIREGRRGEDMREERGEGTLKADVESARIEWLTFHVTERPRFFLVFFSESLLVHTRSGPNATRPTLPAVYILPHASAWQCAFSSPHWLSPSPQMRACRGSYHQLSRHWPPFPRTLPPMRAPLPCSKRETERATQLPTPPSPQTRDGGVIPFIFSPLTSFFVANTLTRPKCDSEG